MDSIKPTLNRLNGQRCYLAGAMDRVKDRGATWRDNITPILENFGVSVFNPLKKPTDVGLETPDIIQYKQQLKSNGQYDELTKLMKTIRSVDLRMVDICDFLVVNLDIDTHPCGTLEEIFLANRQKKPIIIHIEQGKKLTPDWLFGTIPHCLFFSSWPELHEYLKHINSDQNINTLNRWYFFKNV
jgi:nucleoside 2-deoxyribosyltransferase